MVTNSFLLASTLMVGTMAQTTSVMSLVDDIAETGSAVLQGSVISAAPDATTYFVTRMANPECVTNVRGTQSVMKF